MATISFPGFEEYRHKIVESGNRIVGTIKYASYEAAGMVADAIKANAPVDSGALRDSIALTRYRTEKGFTYTKVVFDGYDESGTPNSLKAAALESGTSKMPKRPFVRPAVNRVRKAAQASMAAALDRKFAQMMK